MIVVAVVVTIFVQWQQCPCVPPLFAVCPLACWTLDMLRVMVATMILEHECVPSVVLIESSTKTIFCEFCSNRILPYFPMCVSPSQV